MIEPKYKIGDVVWFPHVERNAAIEKPCPVCFGKKQVTLILGDDTTVLLPCDYCGKGLHVPTGTVTSYEFVAAPEPRTITAVEIRMTGGATVVEYRSGCYVLSDSNSFDTKEEAAAACESIKADIEHEEETKAAYLKKDQAKSYSWNAGYHMREAERLRERIGYHERKAVLCKGKARNGGE